ncbi:HNH endonuclease [Synechococcus sp. PCC 7335]|uniref:HNH endonuclease n=1 Tax=Synechococcus sp. (strain ATCC 29403 / PCC 7335) TaxID=91464 RepID=UPI002100ED71|nr:HNH endonuclease signature motif containing protein [Synechococcus sp. PCC 7335]
MKVKDLTPSRQKLAKRQKFKCPNCGESLLNGDSLHVHHKTPRSKGGKDCFSNWLLLHKVCHQQRHASRLKQRLGSA